MESFSARGTDEQVHVVEAPKGALVEPAPHRTRFGQQVIELYDDGREPTCPDPRPDRAPNASATRPVLKA